MDRNRWKENRRIKKKAEIYIKNYILNIKI